VTPPRPTSSSIEMGKGNEPIRLRLYQGRARREIETRCRHCRDPECLRPTGNVPSDEMRVQVTVAVQKPEACRYQVLPKSCRAERPTVTATYGGLKRG